MAVMVMMTWDSWGDTVVTCHVSRVQGDHISMSRTVSRMSQHLKHKLRQT